MEAQLGESKGDNRAGRFARIALPPVLWIELIADIRLVCVKRSHPNTTVADQLTIASQGQRELEFQARLLGLLVQKHADEGLHLIWRASGPRIIAQIAWIGLIGQDRRPVIGAELA